MNGAEGATELALARRGQTNLRAPLELLYRGTLAACNYACDYCPFAKQRDSRAEIQQDAAEVARFVAWCRDYPGPLKVMFTPWGEALTRKYYWRALIELCQLPHLEWVGIQTNAAAKLDSLVAAQVDKLRLWCTFHPSQTTATRFLKQMARLREWAIPHSVGMVGKREDVPSIVAMRDALPASTYLWVNAFDPRPADYYSAEDIAALTAVDPHFAFQLQPAPSLGAACRAGREALSVNGAGDVRPCHFLAQPLGNLYSGWQPSWSSGCPAARCDCYIGYSLRNDLPFRAPLHRLHAPA
jgi:hypothetical protein